MPSIIVATDLSPPAEAAFARGLAVAKARNELLVLVSADTTIELIPTAPEPDGPALSQLGTDFEAEAARRLADLVARATAAGVTVRTIRAVGDPVDLLIAAARDHDADLIVVGSHGRTGILRFLLGSTAERIVGHAPISVLVARGDATAPFTRVLAATDFSPAAARALALAQELAPAAPVSVIHAWHYPAGAWSLAALGERTHATAALETALTEPPRARGEALVAAERAAGRTIDFRLLEGQPADVVTHLAAAEHRDLIAIGTHGRRGLRRLVVGSVAAATVRHAPCSVLVARPTPA